MFSKKYQRPAGFEEWVESVTDEALVIEAEALGASKRVFTSKANCEKFLFTKKSLSAPSQAGKH